MMSIKPVPEGWGHCRFREWLHCDEYIEAGRIFRQLCRRSYLTTEAQVRDGRAHNEAIDKYINVNKDAKVWRHWYSTLNQMMSQLSPEEKAEIVVKPLPDKRSVAGEWYLAVPAYSSAPEVGIEIIKLLTSRDAEFDRMREGVGLPTRVSLYGPDDANDLPLEVSPHFSVNAAELRYIVNHAFSRSHFGCYTEVTRNLSFSLQKILQIPDTEDLTKALWRILSEFENQLELVGATEHCTKCVRRMTYRNRDL
jgi:hypothetical protein